MKCSLNCVVRVAAALICVGSPALGQIVPKDAASPAEVKQARGEFAARLNGITFPTGKGWKAVMDQHRLFQLMLPEKWKVTSAADDREAALKATPPGADRAVLMVIVSAPRDTDPLEVSADFAREYAETLAEEKELVRRQFKSTDGGLVSLRGMNFALAGGTMLGPRKKLYRQQQFIFIADDRIVTQQFTCLAEDFPKFSEELARVFCSYQTLGMRVKTRDP